MGGFLNIIFFFLFFFCCTVVLPHNTTIWYSSTNIQTHACTHIDTLTEWKRQANSLDTFSMWFSSGTIEPGRFFLSPCCCCIAFITYLTMSNVSRDVCSKNDWGQNMANEMSTLFAFWCFQHSLWIACAFCSYECATW